MDIINSGISTDEFSNNFKAEVILALIATKLNMDVPISTVLFVCSDKS